MLKVVLLIYPLPIIITNAALAPKNKFQKYLSKHETPNNNRPSLLFRHGQCTDIINVLKLTLLLLTVSVFLIQHRNLFIIRGDLLWQLDLLIMNFRTIAVANPFWS